MSDLASAARDLFRRKAPADPGAVSGVLVGVAFIGGVAGAIARSAYPYPRPGSSGEDIRRYFSQPSGAPRISVAGQLISAAALARFTVSVARLAGRTDSGARALQAVAVAGGGIATAGLAGIAGARLSRPH